MMEMRRRRLLVVVIGSAAAATGLVALPARAIGAGPVGTLSCDFAGQVQLVEATPDVAPPLHYWWSISVTGTCTDSLGATFTGSASGPQSSIYAALAPP